MRCCLAKQRKRVRGMLSFLCECGLELCYGGDLAICDLSCRSNLEGSCVLVAYCAPECVTSCSS
eukprot:5428517-Lingulodinium_polyedra.AAC.1